MLELNFTPFPELSTERLLLRRITVKDIPELFFLRSDPGVLQFLSKEPAKNIQEIIDFLSIIDRNIDNNESILWGIAVKGDISKIIGTICYWNITKESYRSEIGYALIPAWWRKGIMKEAITKVLEYGFNTMGLHSVEARLSPANAGSSAVLESTGFVKEGYFKEDFFYAGKFEDTLVYSRLQ
ncbi:MAG: GNAT family N-acetyltransferase [Chitinophagaceae bacterium]|nr:GNAT family N-acetyltransferase [Chitinophagaceae bacterium]